MVVRWRKLIDESEEINTINCSHSLTQIQQNNTMKSLIALSIATATVIGLVYPAAAETETFNGPNGGSGTVGGRVFDNPQGGKTGGTFGSVTGPKGGTVKRGNVFKTDGQGNINSRRVRQVTTPNGKTHTRFDKG
jgi:hypothetical protein